MRIALIGGIYGKDREFRETLQLTPETILERELRRAGHEVETASHHARIDGRRFEVVHVHHLGLGALRMAADRSNASFVYTSHDGTAMAGLRERWGSGAASRWVMSRADGVIALSQAEAEFQRGRYALGGAWQQVIANGIDAETYGFARHNAAGQGQPWRLLYVGQLHEHKRVDLLLRAVGLLPQNLELQLVYQNSEREAELRELAAELGLLGRVHFLGPRRPQELCELYQRADALVLPSAAEALPSVVSEALLCGTPVVATEVGGVREQLEGSGVLVAAGKLRELAEGIERLLEQYRHFAGLAEAASQSARKRFSVESMAARHAEFYAAVAGRSGPRRRARGPAHSPASSIVHSIVNSFVNSMVNRGVDLLCARK